MKPVIREKKMNNIVDAEAERCIAHGTEQRMRKGDRFQPMEITTAINENYRMTGKPLSTEQNHNQIQSLNSGGRSRTHCNRFLIVCIVATLAILITLSVSLVNREQNQPSSGASVLNNTTTSTSDSNINSPDNSTNDVKPSSPCLELLEAKPNDVCTDSWSRLKYILQPSQEAVGYAWVSRKVDKDFSSSHKKAQKVIREKGPIPVVIGPSPIAESGSARPYLLDAHHTLFALGISKFGDGENSKGINVTINIVCNWSHMNMNDFYKSMIQHNFMYGLSRRFDNNNGNGNFTTVMMEELEGTTRANKLPKSLTTPTKDNLEQQILLPSTIMELYDDPWRSLASFVRKIKSKSVCPKHNKYCRRCYIRTCDNEHEGHLTPFFEFRWAYFFNEAYRRGCDPSAASLLWDNLEDCHKFSQRYGTLEYPSNLNDVSLKDWSEAAELLLPLCHGNKTRSYRLPEELFFDTNNRSSTYTKHEIINRTLIGTPVRKTVYTPRRGMEHRLQLPGYVLGDADTIIDEPDPDCNEQMGPSVCSL